MRLLAHRLIPVFLGATFLVSLPATALGQAPISLDDFLGRLARARIDAQSGLSAPSAEQMRRLRADLDMPVDVAVGARVVHVTPDPVLEQLGGEGPEDFALAVRRIDILANRARATAEVHTTTQSEISQALDRAYRGLRSRPGVVDRIQRAASEVLRWLVDSLSHLRGPGSILAWLIVLLLLVPLVPLARHLRLVPDRDSSKGSPDVAVVDWRRLADDAMARGDLREVIRALYGGLLADLATTGLLPDSPSVTAGECRWAVTRGRPDLASVVVDATSAFERVTYGHQAPTSSAVDSLRRASREVAAR